MSGPPNDDRRRYPRMSLARACKQRIGNQRVARTVSAVSAGGMFVHGPDEAFAVGELIVLEFGTEAAPFAVTCEVAYLKGGGAGVRVTRADWDRLCDLLRDC